MTEQEDFLKFEAPATTAQSYNRATMSLQTEYIGHEYLVCPFGSHARWCATCGMGRRSVNAVLAILPRWADPTCMEKPPQPEMIITATS
jgi:hypothetical protein